VKNIKDKFKTLKLLIVGDGPLKEDLKQETQRLGISNDVIFTGYRTDIPQLLSVMDIFVLPSLTEGLPMVLLEAMASRKPIIATNVGAIPKVINKDNGLLVEPKDVTALQRAIEILLNDKGIKQKFASSSYETVMVKFSSEQMCSKYYELYKEVMA